MIAKLRPFRLLFVWVAAVAVVWWYFRTDPDQGRETIQRLQDLAWMLVMFAPVYLGRRALMDGARSKQAYDKAMESATGAGLVFLGLCLLTAALLLAFSSRARAEPLPLNATVYVPVLSDEIRTRWPGMPAPSVLGALVEQETCPSLKSLKCWNPRAELKTEREYGFGLGQTTTAYNRDGTERFNKQVELVQTYNADLKQWTFERRYDARLQLRSIVLMQRDTYRRIASLVGVGEDALAMADSAYNGGYSGVLSDRRLCASVPGCNPGRWFGHVANHSTKSQVKWRGYGESAFGINRGHVLAVICQRRGRYIHLIGEPDMDIFSCPRSKALG